MYQIIGKNMKFYPPLLTSWNSKQKTVLAVAVVSVAFNILVVLPYVGHYYSRLEEKVFPQEYFEMETPDKEILDKVCEATLQLDGVRMPRYGSRGLPIDIRMFFHSRKQKKNDFYASYAMVGVSYYAIFQKDSITMNALRDKANGFIDLDNSTLNYKIEKIDQVSIGLLFLNLYRWYQDEHYLKIAEELLLDIERFMDKDGVVRYTVEDRPDGYLVDALGMYIPFLMEYFQITGDSVAYHIAEHNMEVYYERGVNHVTGLPAHGYNKDTGLHLGSANWGRGIGWYLFAAAFCPQFDASVLQESLIKMEYTQFPGSSSEFDSSTAIMFEIYKQSKDFTRCLSLDFIKTHVLKTGFVDDCSGDTYYLNSYSGTFGESSLCNGLLLILASRFSHIHHNVN